MGKQFSRVMETAYAVPAISEVETTEEFDVSFEHAACSCGQPVLVIRNPAASLGIPAGTAFGPGDIRGRVIGAHSNREALRSAGFDVSDEVTVRVTVRVLHSRSYPGTKWCEPVGWTPKTDFPEAEGWEYVDGSLWGEHEEEAGLAIVTDADEGEEIQVPVSEVFWSSTGDVRFIRNAEVA